MTSIPRNQNFFHLSSIQSVALGLPAIIIGKQLAVRYGAGTAICSIIVGNLVLWLIALAIVSMVQQGMNAIKNITGYIGKHAGFLFALILILAFLDWYALQLNQAVVGLKTLFQYSYPWRKDVVIQIGAIFGLITAMLAIGGIQLLKWMTVICLPIVVAYNIYAISISDYSVLSESHWGVSFPGIVTAIVVLLPGMINLPTFFRHSISKANSFLALTFILVWITFFECASIWMSFSPDSAFVLQNSTPPNFATYVIPTAIFILISLVTTNLLNIYLASACYETFIPFFEGSKGHAIIGLLGTAVLYICSNLSSYQIPGEPIGQLHLYLRIRISSGGPITHHRSPQA